jgi:dienelactone hydrolase
MNVSRSTRTRRTQWPSLRTARSFIARLVIGMTVVAIAARTWTCWAQTRALPPGVVALEPPAGVDIPQVQWITVTAPGYGAMLAAVARPSGAGPFPVVVVLHGSHGFGREYVDLAKALSRGGLIAVAACWFSGKVGTGTDFITSIDWPGLPSRPQPDSDGPLPAIDALVDAVGALPGARHDRIGLFGHSRGGGMVRSYVMNSRKVRAVVLHSTGSTGRLSERASEVSAPILILHGTADSPADGGSPATAVQNARDFEAALRRFKKPVESQYYEGGGHNTIFTNSTQFDHEVKRATIFFMRHLDD